MRALGEARQGGKIDDILLYGVILPPAGTGPFSIVSRSLGDPARDDFCHFRMNRISRAEAISETRLRRRQVPFEDDIYLYSALLPECQKQNIRNARNSRSNCRCLRHLTYAHWLTSV